MENTGKDINTLVANAQLLDSTNISTSFAKILQPTLSNFATTFYFRDTH